MMRRWHGRAPSWVGQHWFPCGEGRGGSWAGSGPAVRREIERQHFAGLFATQDRTIGMNTFLESGPGQAKFEGR